MRDFVERYAPQRRRAWPEIQAFFSSLPAPLTDLGWQFAQRLGRQTSSSGEFADAFEHPAAARVVYLPLWHLDACGQQGLCVANLEALQTHLFASAFLGFCAIRIHDDIVDEDKPDTPVDELLLANLLTMEAIRHLQHLFPSASPFWEHHMRYWREYTQAVRLDKLRDHRGLQPFTETDLLHIGRKASLLKTYPMAVALHTGQEGRLERIEAMMDAFNTAIQINNDIQSLKKDLENAHYTLPLVTAALAVGFEPETHPASESLLRCLAFSPAVADAHRVAHEYYLSARHISVELGIGDLTTFIDWHVDDLESSEQDWRSTCVELEEIPTAFLDLHADAQAADPTVPYTVDNLDRAVDFLSFDPQCRESWEVQRTGVWGRELLIGDVFSRALVVEVLAELDKVAPGQVEEVLNRYRENGWRYYRDFKALPPDIDDIAQAIRLLQYARWDEETKRAYLATPLQWLASNRAADGSFPVWLTEEIEDRPEGGWIPLGGRRCLACEANLLEALSRCPGVTDGWIAAGITSVLDRWKEQRYSGIYYYKPAFGACVLARCFARCLELNGLSPRIRETLSHELPALSAFHAPSAAAPDHLSLAAGLQVSAFARAPSPESVSRDVAALMASQSFDGGWESTGFFRCPGASQRGIGWHGGRLLTTAQIVRALALFQGGAFAGHP